MIRQRTRYIQEPWQRQGPKWFTSPVSFYEGKIADVQKHIPEFERRPFGVTQPGGRQTRLNKRLDIIVRKPTQRDPDYVPVGMVSRGYALIPHSDVLDMASDAMKEAGIDPAGVNAKLAITEYGERMGLSLFLPGKEYLFDPGDGHSLSMRLECLNSVDGSTRFRALMGWFRLVCSNGLVVGVTHSDFRRRHTGEIELEDISIILNSGIKLAKQEIQTFGKWNNHQVKPDRLHQWIIGSLKEKWGFKAAARTYHIAYTGYDVDITGPYKDNTPITIPVEPAEKVPGAPARSKNLYDISQVLAWLARKRRDVQEQLEWREQIPALMEPLVG